MEKEETHMKVSKGTIARTTILVLSMINSGLAIFGKSPLPISDETVTQVVSFGFSTAAALVAWWKNNSFTIPALKADAMIKEAREHKKKGEK